MIFHKFYDSILMYIDVNINKVFLILFILIFHYCDFDI